MPVAEWLPALLVATAAMHVRVAFRIHRCRGDQADGLGSPADLVDTGAGVFECPSCRAENDLGSRFCRSCVEELPGAVPFEGTGGSPVERITR